MSLPVRYTMLTPIERQALYVLGIALSDYTYNRIDTASPISLGVGQFSGQDAETILRMIDADEFFVALPTSIQTELNTQPPDWWTVRFLTKEEANELITTFTHPEVKQIQEDFWKWKAEFYAQILITAGFDSFTQPAEYVFGLLLLQLNPKAACNVFRDAAGTANLEKLYTTALNDIHFYLLWDRLVQPYLILTEWNGASPPPLPTNVDPLLDEGGD